MALNRIHTQATNRPLAFFFHYAQDSEGLDLEAPYQRGDVWSLKRRQNLLRSFLSGVPVPAIVINDRHSAKFREDGYTDERNNAFAVVDGKQRVTTFLMFASDKFGIPAEWLHDDEVETSHDGLVYWSGLTKSGRTGFKINNTVGVVEGRLRNLQEEAELFDLINYGGVAQGEVDDTPFDWTK